MTKALSELNLSPENPAVMGILNVTPDSFSDGGRFVEAGKICVADVLEKARAMVTAGATILDVGGESTRPGAKPVSSAQEMDRVLPVLEQLEGIDAVVSVDTSNPELMLEAAKLGAGLINDVRALQRDGALEAVASIGLPVCLMHMQGSPETMQQRPEYSSIVDEVGAFFQERIQACKEVGIDDESILLDPGFGFGKTLEHNLELLRHLNDFRDSGHDVLVGISRKSMIDHIHQQYGDSRDVEHRLASSLALAQIALTQNCSILRVHDVQETVDMVRMHKAVHLFA